MSQSDPLQFYFDPILTSRQRMMCRMFWNKYKYQADTEVLKQVKRLTTDFGLNHPSELYQALKSCYVYDARYQCQVCQRLRLISNPIDLSVVPKLPYRCDDCSMLIK